jgi:hypothetical protein
MIKYEWYLHLDIEYSFYLTKIIVNLNCEKSD